MNGLKDTIHALQDQIIYQVQKCIQIKSISGDTEGIQKVLEFYLQLGQSMGFKTTNVEGLGGIIQYGQGDKAIGIIVHLDTVPEGTGWQFPPFEGQLKDGKVYGRGAIDDKGPAIAALFALKVFKEVTPQPLCAIQIIIGIDEENVWNTTPKLLEKITEPAFSFVPDSTFPIVIAEKGLLWLELTVDFYTPESVLSKNPVTSATDVTGIIPGSAIVIKQMTGGSNSINIVPDYCEAILVVPPVQVDTVEKQLAAFTQATRYDLSIDQNAPYFKVVSKGKSAHAFNCQEGQNAISQLMLFLNTLDIVGTQKDVIRIYADHIGMENFGESLGLQRADKLTGKLTVSPGFISMDQKSATLKVDIRFPSDQDLAVVTTQTEQAFAIFGGKLTVIDSLHALRFPEGDPHIAKLLQVYKDFTGDTAAAPLGMGGTTFCKAFKRAVAYGPTFPGMAKVEHQPDEYMEIEHLLRCTELYTLALQALAQD